MARALHGVNVGGVEMTNVDVAIEKARRIKAHWDAIGWPGGSDYRPKRKQKRRDATTLGDSSGLQFPPTESPTDLEANGHAESEEVKAVSAQADALTDERGVYDEREVGGGGLTAVRFYFFTLSAGERADILRGLDMLSDDKRAVILSDVDELRKFRESLDFGFDRPELIPTDTEPAPDVEYNKRQSDRAKRGVLKSERGVVKRGGRSEVPVVLPADHVHAVMISFGSVCGDLGYGLQKCADKFCVNTLRIQSTIDTRKIVLIVKTFRQNRRSFITLTVRSTDKCIDGLRLLDDGLRRLGRISLGSRVLPSIIKLAHAFVDDGVAKGKITHGQAVKYHKRIDRWHKKVKGKGLRVRDLWRAGVRKSEVTYTDGVGWHWHNHGIYDLDFLPVQVLRALWMRATRDQGEIVDIQRVDKSGDASKELGKYISKPYDLKDRPDLLTELRLAVHGYRNLRTVGDVSVKDLPKPEHACNSCGKDDCESVLLEIVKASSVVRDKRGRIVKLKVDLRDGAYMLEMVDGRLVAVPLFNTILHKAHSQTHTGNSTRNNSPPSSTIVAGAVK